MCSSIIDARTSRSEISERSGGLCSRRSVVGIAMFLQRQKSLNVTMRSATLKVSSPSHSTYAAKGLTLVMVKISPGWRVSDAIASVTTSAPSISTRHVSVCLYRQRISISRHRTTSALAGSVCPPHALALNWPTGFLSVSASSHRVTTFNAPSCERVKP